jgi:SnoaL-like domain
MVDDLTVALTDQLEVHQVLIRYAHALDARDWELLRSCFTPDATTDYGEIAGINDGREAIVSTCRNFLSGLDASHHMIGSVAIDCEGDDGTAVCYLQAQHVFRGADGGDNLLHGGIYRDRLVRTPEGWKISHRSLELVWQDGNPAVVEYAAARWAKAQ